MGRAKLGWLRFQIQSWLLGEEQVGANQKWTCLSQWTSQQKAHSPSETPEKLRDVVSSSLQDTPLVFDPRKPASSSQALLQLRG